MKIGCVGLDGLSNRSAHTALKRMAVANTTLLGVIKNIGGLEEVVDTDRVSISRECQIESQFVILD